MIGIGTGLTVSRRFIKPAEFTPASLFASGEIGAWYDFNDLSTMWQDDTGLIAVAASGDVVARVDDKSGNGKHLIQSTTAARPVYTSDANGGRLVFDGVDDFMPIDGTMLAGTNYSVHMSWRQATDPGTAKSLVIGGTNGTLNSNLHVGWLGNTDHMFGQWSNDISGPVAWSATPRALSAILRSDGRFLRSGGAQIATSTDLTHLVSWDGASIGRRKTTEFYTPEVYSLILRAADITDGTARRVEDYQAERAGITL